MRLGEFPPSSYRFVFLHCFRIKNLRARDLHNELLKILPRSHERLNKNIVYIPIQINNIGIFCARLFNSFQYTDVFDIFLQFAVFCIYYKNSFFFISLANNDNRK